jgi:NAD(P)-dependent dehydrogenase (short-subunit alcohol dehydrogenase family)
VRGRVALVTGAGQGMGRAIAVRLAASGARVAANDLNPNTAAVTAALVGGVAAPFDCADPDAVGAGIAAVERAVGPVELLVANHAFMTMAPFLDEPEEHWRRTLDANLLGTAWLVERVVPGMRRAAFGRIVVITSEWGVVGWANATPYTTSKGGLIGLAKSAARALAADGIAVNAVAPGITDTPQLDVDARDAGVDRAEIARRYATGVPLGRIGAPEDIAEVVAFLLSADAGAIVGQVVQPNGGTTRAG